MAASDSGFSEGLPLVRPLDEEQARLVEILLAAGGSEVSFEELRRQGIENPAVLAYELEIAGLAITHVQRLRPGGRARSVGLRLDATLAPTASSQERPRDRESLAASQASPAGGAGEGASASLRPRRGLISGIAAGLAAVVLIGLVIALAAGTGSGSGKGQSARLALEGSPANRAGAAPSTPRRAGVSTGQGHHKRSRPSPHAPAAGQAPPLDRAGQLQQAGHLLLAEGRYAAAIPELRAALSASGESATSCSEPTTPGCVAYAEALYDLGRALRLDNAPAAAGAVLRERLQIDSQRAAVQHELGLNRRSRSSAPATRTPAHARTPHKTTSPPPAPKPRPNPGGASAPAQTQAETGAGTPTTPAAGAQPSTPEGSTAP